MDREFNKTANALLAKERPEEARRVLEAAIQRMPDRWTPVREDSRFVQISFWDQEEFFAYVRHSQDALKEKSMFWTDSYSRAWYILSSLASKQIAWSTRCAAQTAALHWNPTIPNSGARRVSCSGG
ncbi:MAG: hypothetical protein ACRD19_11670 [Terriglobia bacterium]